MPLVLLSLFTAISWAAPPVITRIDPERGTWDDVVTITGTGLNDPRSLSISGTEFKTGDALSVTSDGTSLQARVPARATTGWIEIETRDGRARSPGQFYVHVPPPPVITSVQPARGNPGTPVLIRGSGFAGASWKASEVGFNDVQVSPQTYEVIDASTLYATLPAGSSSGSFTVVGPNGKATSQVLYVTQERPAIEGFAPLRGNEGERVQIRGSSFGPETKVSFGGVAAPRFKLDRSGTLTVEVPKGDVAGPIQITNSYGTVQSNQSFGSVCAPLISSEKSLLVTHLSVVNDPMRTRYRKSKPDDARWSFVYLMSKLAPTGMTPPQFILSWLLEWSRISKRPAVDQLLADWPKTSTGELDLEKAPIRLLGIVNRIDQRRPGDAGEARFVYGATDIRGSPRSFVWSVEYAQPIAPSRGLKEWALAWYDLGQNNAFDETFKSQLQAITDLLGPKDFSQIRTNEAEPGRTWEMREFKLASDGRLVSAPVKGTPDPKFNGEARTELAQWIRENTTIVGSADYELPAKFSTLFAPMDGGSRWLSGTGISDSLRRGFSLQTCNGCHSGETGTSFLHIGNRLETVSAGFSPFLARDLERRQRDLQNLVIQENCGKPGKDGALWIVASSPGSCDLSQALAAGQELLQSRGIRPLGSSMDSACLAGFLIRQADLQKSLELGFKPGPKEFRETPRRVSH